MKHPPLADLIDRVYDHAETQNTATHARLILSGIGNNPMARRLIAAFCTVTTPAGTTDRVQARVLAGLTPKRFTTLLLALRSCGALLPALHLRDDGEAYPELFSQLEAQDERIFNARDPQGEVERWWRLEGEMINPALAQLLKEESQPS